MNFIEAAAKALVLVPAGIAVPPSRACRTPDDARIAFAEIGPCVVKAQVPTGKRGKAGGIKAAHTAEAAAAAARDILSLTIDGYRVESLLLEQLADIAHEFYAAVLIDTVARLPLVLFSTQGGMDIEDVAARNPADIARRHVPPGTAFDHNAARALLADRDIGGARDQVADVLVKMFAAFSRRDAELIEINPLAVLKDGRVVALDCKLVMDDASRSRQADLAAFGAREHATQLETEGAAAGLTFIELDGDIGVLANGAGLTMTTMDVIAHQGGKPANFLEIGGEAYTKSEVALGLILRNPRVKSLVVNFCGAFARTDVMADGVVKAWQKLRPTLPVFFSIHGTGEDEARTLVRRELGLEPFDFMEDAVAAAIFAAGKAP